MKKQLLLRVQDSFLISGRGLVVIPHVEPIPSGFRSFTDSVVAKRPDESEIEWMARFELTHFKLQKGSKWAIAVILPIDDKQLVPIGSELWVSENAFGILNGS